MQWKKLLEWSRANYQDLPWRRERTLYGTLVSEIMLQQTTVSTVLNHYPRFIKAYPDLQTLAQASEEEMVMAWKGLGYYRRARNLLKACKEICEKYDGEIPLERDELLSINGIGPYTASALMAIGADQPELALDANLERVIARLYQFEQEKGPKLQKEIRESYLRGEVLKQIKKNPRDLNEALMDLGRVYCQARRAECLLCPLSSGCMAAATASPTDYPKVSLKKTKAMDKHELKLLRVVVQKKDQILGLKKTSGQWLEGQIEVPTFVLGSTDRSFKQYPKLTAQMDLGAKFEFKTGITKYKIHNVVVTMSPTQYDKTFGKDQSLRFYSIDDSKANLATSTIKILRDL